MIKKEWLSEENLTKFGVDIKNCHPFVVLVNLIKDSAHNSGYKMSLSESIDLTEEVTIKTRSLLKNDSELNHFLFLSNNTGIGPSCYFTINPDFDWNWYKQVHIDKCYERESEFELLKSIVIEIHNCFGFIDNGKVKYYGRFPKKIEDNLIQWNEKFYKES